MLLMLFVFCSRLVVRVSDYNIQEVLGSNPSQISRFFFRRIIFHSLSKNINIHECLLLFTVKNNQPLYHLHGLHRCMCTTLGCWVGTICLDPGEGGVMLALGWLSEADVPLPISVPSSRQYLWDYIHYFK